MTPAPERSFRKRVRLVARRLGPFARLHRRYLALGSAAGVAIVLCRLAFPWPLQGVMDIAFDQGDASGLLGLVPAGWNAELVLVAAFLLVVIGQGAFEMLQRVWFSRFAVRVMHDARGAAIATVSQQYAGDGRQRAPGEMVSRIVGDTARAKAGVRGVLIHVTQKGVYVVGVAIALLVIDLRLGLVFTATALTAAALASVTCVRLARLGGRQRRKEGKLAQEIVRAVQSGDPARQKFQRINRDSGRNDARSASLQGRLAFAVHTLMGLSTSTILLLGIAQVEAGALRPSTLFTVVVYLLMVHNSTVRMSRQIARSGLVIASAERLAKVLPAESPGRHRVRRTPRTRRARLTVEHDRNKSRQ